MDTEFKLSFLKSLKITQNGIPYLFIEGCASFVQDTTELERWFSNLDSLSGVGIKKVSLKNIIGTNHPNYANKGWMDAFLSTEKGKDCITLYQQNPSYYFKELKRTENTLQNTPLEVVEKDGKYYIKKGNHLILFLKMLYLAEVSHTEDEEKVNEKYSFPMKVNTIPENEECISILYALKKFGYTITRYSEEEYHYILQEKQGVYKTASMYDLKKVFKQSISLNGMESKEEFIKRMQRNINFFSRDMQRLHLEKIFLEVFPHFELFQKYYLDTKRQIEDLLATWNISNLSYENLFSYFEQIALKEEEQSFFTLFTHYQNFHELYEKIISHPFTKKRIQRDMQLQEFIYAFSRNMPFLYISPLPNTYQEVVQLVMTKELIRQYDILTLEMKKQQELETRLAILEKIHTILEHKDFLSNLCNEYEIALQRLASGESNIILDEQSLIRKKREIEEIQESANQKKKRKKLFDFSSKKEQKNLEKELKERKQEKGLLETNYSNTKENVMLYKKRKENALKELKTLLSNDISFSYVESILQDETLSLPMINQTVQDMKLKLLTLNTPYKLEQLMQKAKAYHIDLEMEIATRKNKIIKNH